MIKASWDIERAKKCKLPEYILNACEMCRVKRYCFRQVSIFDIGGFNEANIGYENTSKRKG